MKQSTGRQITGKLSTGILLLTLAAGSAWAQIPTVIQHVQDKMNDVQQQKTAASDAALDGKSPAGKPAAATAAKPAAAPVVKSAAAPATKVVVSPAQAKPAVANAAPIASKPVASAKAATTVAPVVKSAAAVAKPTAPVAKSAVPVAKKDPFARTGEPKAAKPVEKADASATDARPESKEEAAERKKESGFITAGNRRDPFVSPIVQHMGGSGCSTGKRCLAIDQIALRGIVKSDAGMIAVVVNSLDKAYFLRENDPVFNGYVLKISGDSVVFKETVQDKLGHLSTREVVKKITTPAV